MTELKCGICGSKQIGKFCLICGCPVCISHMDLNCIGCKDLAKKYGVVIKHKNTKPKFWEI